MKYKTTLKAKRETEVDEKSQDDNEDEMVVNVRLPREDETNKLFALSRPIAENG